MPSLGPCSAGGKKVQNGVKRQKKLSRTTARLASLADSFSSFSLSAELTYAKLFAKIPGIKKLSKATTLDEFMTRPFINLVPKALFPRLGRL